MYPHYFRTNRFCRGNLRSSLYRARENQTRWGGWAQPQRSAVYGGELAVPPYSFSQSTCVYAPLWTVLPQNCSERSNFAFSDPFLWWIVYRIVQTHSTFIDSGPFWWWKVHRSSDSSQLRLHATNYMVSRQVYRIKHIRINCDRIKWSRIKCDRIKCVRIKCDRIKYVAG